MSDSLIQEDIINCFRSEGVVEGFCVVLRGDMIAYAGPIGQSPKLSNWDFIYMSPADFDKLQADVKKRRQ